ncbi:MULTISPECIES: SEC-C metal-binding domain-containing protein [Pseudomonas]|jgi:hypothetical protein|uniref:Zinc chelation protein SecC n=3 Tax=Pseudomonas putida TaxID=303 RepID=A0A140FW45_PSEPK|nr:MULTISPECIES: SEC-C metal-binding domain-containing protein [Pseudomonas]AMM02828.1 conserved protein of unknown function with SEC-C motif domain [Pseudomonas putida KT2440]KAF0251180.1 hypothetical protein GN299_30005 [Pseudomonas putida]KMU96603.1 hypothetical protein AC138_07650 [Pseudomonas putida]MDD2080746.1 SEC-C metal-binding domain-containing protein [Pseudomonas putida]PXZ48145.1 hypothetical protein DM483_18040 [Pseudomonas sp. SMT-1]
MYGLRLLENEFPESQILTQQILKLISARSYDDALTLAKNTHTTINDIKAGAAEDFVKNNCFIYFGFFELLSSLASYWKCIEAEKYHDSWCNLQDALDCLRQLKRFYKEDSITLTFLTRQLLSIEKAYPYKHFSSCGFIIEKFECSICSKNMDSDECPHIKGDLYSGVMARAIARQIKNIDHLAIVTNPKNKRLVLIPDDNHQQFDLFRKLIGEFNSKKCSPLSIARVNLIESHRPDPDHKRAPRNSPCYCGSGKKYKSCCIKSERMAHIHMNISIGPLLNATHPLLISSETSKSALHAHSAFKE